MSGLVETKKLLEKFQILPRQSLGQNFLVDDRSVGKIIALSQLEPTDRIIEIGPGCGSITGPMLDIVDQVTAYEIDGRLVNLLEKHFADKANFRLCQGDFLKADLAEQFSGQADLKLVANLPYYISSACIEKVICELPMTKSLSLMLQKEAADRLTLDENHSRYGITAILLSLYGRIQASFKLGPNAFYPRPKVQSQVLFIQADPSSCFRKKLAEDPNFKISTFREFLTKAFAMRRKTLINNLKAGYPKVDSDIFVQVLDQVHIQLKQRPEEVTAEKFWQLFDSVAEYVSKV